MIRKMQKTGMVSGKRVLQLVLFFTFICLCMPLRVQAAGQEGWKEKKGCHYYYKENGKKATGLTVIGSKTYYFNKKGVMQTGWQKLRGEYYYFDRNTGKQMKGCKVDGIKIKKDGTVKKTKYNKEKIDTMITAHKLVNQLTKPTDSKKTKMKKCFKWVSKFPYKRYRFFEPIYKQKGWEMTFANDIFKKKQGDCVSGASAVAFLFHECGCKTVYICHDTEHAWVELNGRVYDPLFARVKNFDKYYNGTYKSVGLWATDKRKI
ncbi:MAG: hypothetical protein K2L07_11460 [Lachnospiraceae bacterium]|nr:hypothetical protein [Lachnospiraceae bacterium]